jgi:hypothetical protein
VNLGYDNVPQGQVGWNGSWGTIPVQGPEPPPPGPRPPMDHEVAESHITTEWTCAFCGADNDVWGVAEGWMDCDRCPEQSYLVSG